MVHILILQTGQKRKKATKNPKNMDDKCFQYAATVALNYEEIESHPERVSSIKSFINKYNWERINYSSKIDDWKTFGKNNPTIALNILYTKEKKYAKLISQKLIQIVKKKNLLMIPNEKKRRMALSCSKKLSTLLRGTSWGIFMA